MTKAIKEINNNDFQKYFLVAYASTIHSSQGMSIDEIMRITPFISGIDLIKDCYMLH
jgi:hypothetical protein